jgi:S-adenosylmethionine:tRNA ribosyltransferase-isomerase
LSGVHERGESHHALLGAFADTALLDRALEHAARQGFRSHELGDAMLILPNALGRRTTRDASSAEPAAGGSSAVDRQP